MMEDSGEVDLNPLYTETCEKVFPVFGRKGRMRVRTG
jgi:hypothetical protein